MSLLGFHNFIRTVHCSLWQLLESHLILRANMNIERAGLVVPSLEWNWHSEILDDLFQTVPHPWYLAKLGLECNSFNRRSSCPMYMPISCSNQWIFSFSSNFFSVSLAGSSSSPLGNMQVVIKHLYLLQLHFLGNNSHLRWLLQGFPGTSC